MVDTVGKKRKKTGKTWRNEVTKNSKNSNRESFLNTVKDFYA